MNKINSMQVRMICTHHLLTYLINDKYFYILESCGINGSHYPKSRFMTIIRDPLHLLLKGVPLQLLYSFRQQMLFLLFDEIQNPMPSKFIWYHNSILNYWSNFHKPYNDARMI